MGVYPVFIYLKMGQLVDCSEHSNELYQFVKGFAPYSELDKIK